MPSLRFTGTVENGRLVLDDPQGWRSYLSSLVGKRFELSIQQERKARTLKQNAFSWAGGYPYIAEWSGHTVEEIHAAMKQMFCPEKRLDLPSGEFVMVKSTRLLSDEEMSQYVHDYMTWGREQGVRFPEPHQVGDLS